MKALLLLFVFLFVSSAWAQSQEIKKPIPPITSETEGADKSENNAKAKQSESINLPSSVDIKIGRKLEIYSDKRDGEANAESTKWTDPISIFTGLLVVVTAILAVFTYLLWNSAIEASGRQAIEMKDSLRIAGIASDAAKKSADASLVALRPWLSCEVQIADSLTYTTEGDALFAFRFIVKNVGHSPAMNISFLPHLTLLSPKHELSLIYLQRMAEIYRSMPPKMTTMIIPGGTTGISEPGLLLFPGEHFTFNYRIPLKRSEIEKACEDIKPQMHFFPELCGLITYTYPLATVRADTGFILRVEKALADGRRGDVLKLDEPVLLENMRLSDHGLWGGFAT